MTQNQKHIILLTNGPKHHFFGFHDLEVSSRKTGNILTLAVDQINRPPVMDDQADVCILSPDEPYEKKVITTTSTYNFPQGARQQWLADGENFIVNQRTNNKTIASVYDVETKEKVAQLDRGCHIADRNGKFAYSIDYGRLHRLGGYGYAGIPDEYPDEPAPNKSGIFCTEISANQTRLILSIAEVVERNTQAKKSKSHHYFTHLCLNPKGDRLAFLHRYRLPDGGEDTCLVTVGTDGADCRILARGFLSHFDWKDDRSIFIWGRKSSSVSNMRNSAFLGNPLLKRPLMIIKNILRPLMAGSSTMQMSFLLVSDDQTPVIKEIGMGVLTEDGHPMFNPINRDWVVIDNYPDKNGVRNLMLYRISDQSKIGLGNFSMSPEKPSKETVKLVAVHIRDQIDVSFPPELYAFTRSGLHCDLHPRWFADGKSVAFDSIHEGQRQLYAVNVSQYIAADQFG